MPKQYIDIEQLIRSKNPGLIKWLPGFVIRYLKRILHQDEINKFLAENEGVEGMEFCENVMKLLQVDVSMNGLERIPKEGKVVLAMNHPLGGLDAMMLITALKGHREDLKFMVNDLLMNLNNIQNYFVGVNKHGRLNNSTMASVRELFTSDNAVCIFPAGLVSRKIKGEVMDLEWKKTFVTQSKANDRTIIPIFIEGKLSNFFYRLHRFRTFLGIKANVEMLYLANELFKQRGQRLKFHVGLPIEKELLVGKDNRKIAQKIKERVYAMRK